MDITAVKLGWDVIKTLISWKKGRPVKSESQPSTFPLAVAQRYVQLFEAHGVMRSQIPAFFDHGFEIKHFLDDETLLEQLTEVRLQAATDLFGIKREWLDGTSEEIYDVQCFYKDPEGFKTYLDTLLCAGKVRGGYLLVADEVTRRSYNALLILEEAVGCVGDIPIYRFHVCGDWIYEYWKCRAYITACVAYAWEKNAYIDGRKLPEKDMLEFASGSRFLNICEWHGGIALDGHRFDADDLADNPSFYLDGVDEGLRGKVLGLERWLELEAKGFMNIGYGKSKREDFEQALNLVNKYRSLSWWQRRKHRRLAIKEGRDLFVFQNT